MKLFKSPLYKKYNDSKAKLVDFAGWEMPITFSGLVQEHEAVRNTAGLFDISHMGVISIKGTNPKEIIQKFFPTNLYSINKGQSCYSLLLNNDGGIIDDLIIYDLGLQENDISEIVLIVNASRYEADLEWLNKNLSNNKITISNAKIGNSLLALQGKKAYDYFEEWSGYSIKHLHNFGCEYKILKKFPDYKKIFISKTGYTGEEGIEILLPKELSINLWDFLLTKGVLPCGLGSRDTLRLEAGMHLYGQELNEKTNPYEAGLGWVVHLENQHDFFGRKALEKISLNGIKRKLVGIEVLGKAIARTDCEILVENKKIGSITSGSWSPTLKKPIALGYIDINYATINSEVDLKIRGKLFKGIISKRAFYKKID